MTADTLTPALRRFFGVDSVVPSSRAALGIYAALSVWSGGRTLTVALPASICQDVIVAVRMADCVPHFCDVDVDTGLVTGAEWRKARAAGALVAIVVHLYGNPADVDLVRNIFPAPDCLLIDDAAQALGARTTVGLSGTGGDVGVVSFGATKHIEVGGAALLCSDACFATECASVLAKVVPTDADRLHSMQANFRRRYLIARERLVREEDPRGFAGLLDGYEPLLRMSWQPSWSDEVATRLSDYPTALAQRLEKVDLWSCGIVGSGLVPVGMRSDGGCAPWRYACRLPGCPSFRHQHELGESLRSRGLNVSHWYLPGNWWLGELACSLPSSEQLAREAFQFWLDDGTAIETIKQWLPIVKECLQAECTDH